MEEQAPTERRFWRDPGSLTRRIAAVVTLGAVVGFSSGAVANIFVGTFNWLNDLLLISPDSRAAVQNARLITWATLAVPTAGGLIGGILHWWISDRQAHSPADLIAAVQTRRGRLPLRDEILTGLSSLTSLSFGASVGQYGPLVHVGGTLGSAVSRLFRASITRQNTAIACGVAAAISSAFHAPIAGILFAHEVVLRHFALRAFAPIAIASVLGHVASVLVWPQPLLFTVAEVEVAHLWEFALFIALGVCSAFIAVAYMSAILGMARIAQRIRVPAVLRPAIAGLGLGLAALWVPDILGLGLHTLRLALVEGGYHNWQLLLVLGLKLLATAWCLGMGFAGGIFSPALIIGSLFGALFFSIIGSLTGLDLSAQAVYAICGMVAVTAPVIGAPLAVIAIVFEMTVSYDVTIAALASVALANLVTSRRFGRSLFDQQLAERGKDLSGGRSRAILRMHSIGELVSDRPLMLDPDTRVAEARRAMAGAGTSQACLVDSQAVYEGTVHLHDLLDAGDHEPARRWRDDNAMTMREDETVWDAMHALREFVGEAVAVVNEDGRLVGIVYESDLITAYLDLLEGMRREEHSIG